MKRGASDINIPSLKESVPTYDYEKAIKLAMRDKQAKEAQARREFEAISISNKFANGTPAQTSRSSDVLVDYAKDLVGGGISIQEVAKRFAASQFAMKGRYSEASVEQLRPLIEKQLANLHVEAQQYAEFNKVKNTIVSNILKQIALNGHTVDIKREMSSHGIAPQLQESYLKEAYAARSNVAFVNFINNFIN